jgi:hypothetical protein
MNGPFDWVMDEDIGGPYGYNTLIVQKDGVRFSCDSPLVRTTSPKDMYGALVDNQRRLIRERPRTLEEAFLATSGKRLWKIRLVRSVGRRLASFFQPRPGGGAATAESRG